MENIDLKTCSNGDILVSKHGKKFIYREYKPENMFPHVIQEVGAPKNRGWGSRLDNGQVFANNRLPDDHDIVEIIKK